MATDPQLLALVRPILHGKDIVHVALSASDEASASAPAASDRLIAVISSTVASGVEEGCIFVFTLTEQGKLGDLDTIPITHDFQLSIAQVQIASSKASRTPTSPSAPRAFALTLESPSRGRSLKLTTSAPGALVETLTTHCRRLKATAESALEHQPTYNRTHHLTTAHAWVQQYRQQVVTIFPSGTGTSAHPHPDVNLSPQQRTAPLDAKLPLQYPISKRLSKMSAGFQASEVQEVHDLELLQDDWVRRQLNVASRAHTGNPRLRLRMCSFNVNGKDAPAPTDHVPALGHWINPLGGTPGLATPTGKTSLSREFTTTPTMGGRNMNSATVASPGSSRAVKSPAMVRSDTLFSAGGADVDVDLKENEEEEEEEEEEGDEPDLLVVTLQELDLSTEALIYATNPARDDAWTAAVVAALGHRADGDEYVKVASKQLVGMLVILIATRAVRPRIRDVRTASVGVGIMGLMGNKGAVGLRVRVDGSTLTFVCAHLAAFDEQHARRDADFVDITRRMLFLPSGIADVALPSSPLSAIETDPEALAAAATARRRSTVVENPMFDPNVIAASALPIPLESLVPLEKASMWDTDALFWSGDFNYRLDLPDADIREMLTDANHPRDRHNIQALLRWDQLKASQRNETAFAGFTEADIRFLPTYRFDTSIPTDSNGYDMKRKPAWTDRILHMSSELIGVETLSYDGHHEVTLSDHKPISSDFYIETDALSSTSRQILMQTLLRRTGDWLHDEDAPPPKVEVSPANMDFGDVEYDGPLTRELTIKNVGQVPCGFRFIPPAPNVPLCDDWLTLKSSWGIVMPGETLTIPITVHVTAKNAYRLNTGTRKLEETLILHAMRGKDYFVAVSGKYLPTCFGTELRWLARLPGPIREYSKKQPKQELLSEDRATNAPMEVINLISWLMQNGLETSDLFLVNGDIDRVKEIRNALDIGSRLEDSLSSSDASSVADTLLDMLDSLPSPVVPLFAHAQCAQIYNREDAFELVQTLPPVNRNVLMSLASFLHFYIEQTSHEGAPEDKARKINSLAAIFTPVLLRDDQTTASISPMAKRRFLVSLLQT
ncbi:DNase I-like protein [Auriculariales sp. MPI-PUGE-AT-0066]|nr:DNase I-like protein [Auriculariales sp. MPI-PUGE-AT-0066]